jgi:lipid-A-disaccharide synthase
LLKKIFIITGENSGDKIASLIVKKIKSKNININFLAVGGNHLKSEKINCIFDIKDIAFMGIIDVLKNLFVIKKKINFTIKKIIEFNPDLIISIDAPDFSFRILKKIKSINSKIKTIHLVAPQVWAWRENRKKFLHKFIDHLLLLFPFEKKYFDGFIKNSLVGHPFFDSSVFTLIDQDKSIKKYLTLCPGSRNSEINTFMPIFIELIKKINVKYNFIFHIPTTDNNKDFILRSLKDSKIDNFIITSDENDKNFYIRNSIISVSKSGTITLDICKNQCPLIVIFKTSLLNYLLIKPFIKVRFGNILNIIADKEVIPELIQDKCNVNDIYFKIEEFLNNKEIRDRSVIDYTESLKKIIVPDSLDRISDSILN